MKKYKNPNFQFDRHIPSCTELQQLNLRGIKDRQAFEWLIFSSRGRATIELMRTVLHLPKDGIKPITDYPFTRLEDLPNFPSNTEVLWERLNYYTRHTLELLQLSGRFFESVKSFLIFNRAIPAAAPVRVTLVGIPPSQELFLEAYPDRTFRDIRAAWRTVMLMQGQLPKHGGEKHKGKWSIDTGKESNSRETTVFIKIYKDTVLEDLNNKNFRNKLERAFKQRGVKGTPYRAWNIKMVLKLQQLDANKNLSDEERAEELFKSGYLQDNIQKVRRIRHKSKHK